MNQVEVNQKNAAQITQALKQAAQANKNINNVSLVFAMRERTRFQVTVGSLRLAMAQEGYAMTIKEIEEVLTFFASLGIGKLQYDDKKRLTGLMEVKWTLQSVGRAALGDAPSVTRAERQRRYANLPTTVQQKTPTPMAVAPVPLKATPQTHNNPPAAPLTHQVYLTTQIAGKEIKFPYPTPLTSDEFMALMAELNEAGGVSNPGRKDKGGNN